LSLRSSPRSLPRSPLSFQCPRPLPVWPLPWRGSRSSSSPESEAGSVSGGGTTAGGGGAGGGAGGGPGCGAGGGAAGGGGGGGGGAGGGGGGGEGGGGGGGGGRAGGVGGVGGGEAGGGGVTGLAIGTTGGWGERGRATGFARRRAAWGRFRRTTAAFRSRSGVVVLGRAMTRRSKGTRPRGSIASGTCASSNAGVGEAPYDCGTPDSAARAHSQADPATATATAPMLAPSASPIRARAFTAASPQRTSFARAGSRRSGRARADGLSPSAARSAHSVLSNVPRAPATNTWKPRLSNSLPQN
jgi:hypothetical protein